MTDLKQAAQQALEALESAHPKPHNEDVRAHYEAITALRAALEQPEQQCSGCGKSDPGYALYCVECIEKTILPALAQPEQEAKGQA